MKILPLITALSLATLHAEEVRIMAANISSGNHQSYDPGEGGRIFRGLAPDIVLIQEFNFGNNSDSDLDGFVEDNFGPEFSYVEEGKSSGQIQNGVISRYPILSSGVWDDSDMSNREFVWARIDVPGENHLWAISVHFKASSGSTNTNRRLGEAQQLVDYIEANVPEEDFLVVGGDFNTQNRTESCLRELAKVVDIAAPYPTDRNGVGGTNASRAKPYDWVMTESSLRDFEIPVILGERSYPSGIVFDSRVFTPLSAVSPVLAADSGVFGMQHMAVMRSFDLGAVSPYSQWIAEFYPENAPTQIDELADPDLDGQVNLLEFAVGNNPSEQDANPLLSISRNGPEVTLQYPVRLENGEEILGYSLESGTSPMTMAEATGGTTTDDAPVGDFKIRKVRFTIEENLLFRLRVWPSADGGE